MSASDQSTETASTLARICARFPRIQILFSIIKWLLIAAVGLFSVLFVIAVGGIRVPSPFANSDVSHQKPFVDSVGRSYRVTGPVTAHVWNDFPDKAKIEVVTLMPPPGVANRFVSYRIPLKLDQRVQIDRAWRAVGLFGYSYHYEVSVPGAGLPTGIKIVLRVGSDGVPDPLLYEATGR